MHGIIMGSLQRGLKMEVLCVSIIMKEYLRGVFAYILDNNFRIFDDYYRYIYFIYNLT